MHAQICCARSDSWECHSRTENIQWLPVGIVEIIERGLRDDMDESLQWEAVLDLFDQADVYGQRVGQAVPLCYRVWSKSDPKLLGWADLGCKAQEAQQKQRT